MAIKTTTAASSYFIRFENSGILLNYLKVSWPRLYMKRLNLNFLREWEYTEFVLNLALEIFIIIRNKNDLTRGCVVTFTVCSLLEPF